ncbi:UDP-glucose 4-epimerase [Methylacidimicrobium tartarophylax]|uniref:UDP-glucose 4-epimerase n=2 Tax=Methylacidimicrobium tartarophylax TaxID=1041768 RepID=A0A5E6M8I0_9BACT|nr:UDP-glucose 4-epimerase GalE [Methylacidimicrobium tartarophylax]VVM05673.1 UDP-glucose 4-epimerase [Methylacidimicrobium tartarophylax]
MKILVTGGAGYVGSICVEHLLDSGIATVVVDNLSEGHRAAVDERAAFHCLDLRDREPLLALMQNEKPDAVIHFAANAYVAESMRDPSTYFRNNVSHGIHLLDAMVATGVRKIVFSSTCAVYGLPLKIPIEERSETRPINPYGESKLCFEKILRWYAEIHGIVPLILRYFNAAGASERRGEDHREEPHLIPRVLQVALGQRKSVEVCGDGYATSDGTAIRDYVHVRDLAAAHLAVLQREQPSLYNVGTGEGYSVLQVIETAREVTGCPIPHKLCPPRPGDPPRLVADVHKIRQELSWAPAHSRLSKIIESAWQWHRTHPAGYPEHF